MTWKKEASRGRAGVDGIRKAFELHTLFVKLTDQVNEMLK